MKLISNLSYEIYKIPDPEEQTTALGQAMVHAIDLKNLVKDAQEETIFDEIDLDDIKQFVTEFSYERCYVILQGNDLLTRKDIELPSALSKTLKEKRFSSKYRMHEKPTKLHELFMSLFLDDAWYRAVLHIEQP